jgi:pyruvate-formate lyase-activating enzyme
VHTPLVINVQKYSIHDGPGIRTTFFFKGCPLSCTWCHNPESQSFSRELLYRAENCRLCGACAQVCPAGAVDTCGEAPYERFARVLPYVELFLYDLKLMDCQAHERYTGRPNGRILDNLRALSRDGAGILLRLPLVERVNSGDGDIGAILAFLNEGIHVKGIHLLPYHDTGRDKYERLGRSYGGGSFHPPAPERLEQIARRGMSTSRSAAAELAGRRETERVLCVEERGMNERVRALRRKSLETQPRIYMERARLMTDAYKKYEGSVSVPELRALAFLHFMEHRTLYLGEGELIVGEKGDGPQAAPTVPELCCHSLEDMRLMNERELIRFTVGEEDFAIQEEEILRYWHDRSIRSRILKAMTPEWRDCYESGIFTEFMEQRGPGYTVGSENIYRKGFLDYKREIARAVEALDFLHDPEAPDKREQLTAMDICCDAIITLGRRYAAYARELAERERNPARRQELLQIAENCEVVPAHRPRTYWQALQMHWFVHLGVTTELNPWDAYSPGRLDQHLRPFYQADCARGILDEDRARELLECLWVKFNNQPAPPKVGITLKESSTYTDFANINTGGITPDGADGVNDVSHLILDCMDGHHIQFNVVDRNTLLEAQKHPQEYRDLIVRVAGYSDHFRNLSRELQDEIIARTEQAFA